MYKIYFFIGLLYFSCFFTAPPYLRKKLPSQQIQENVECPIWFNEIKKDENYFTHKELHFFHIDCISKWAKKNPIWPFDREKLTS